MKSLAKDKAEKPGEGGSSPTDAAPPSPNSNVPLPAPTTVTTIVKDIVLDSVEEEKAVVTPEEKEKTGDKEKEKEIKKEKPDADDTGKENDSGEDTANTKEKPPKKALAVGDFLRGKEIIEMGVKGTVKWFNVMKGYGFVNRTDQDKDIFVHRTAIRFASRITWPPSLGEREDVEFAIVKGPNKEEVAWLTGPGEKDVIGSEFAPPYKFRWYIYREGGPYIGPPPPPPPMFAQGYKFSHHYISRSRGKNRSENEREKRGSESKDAPQRPGGNRNRNPRKGGPRRERGTMSTNVKGPVDGVTPVQIALQAKEGRGEVRRRSTASEHTAEMQKPHSYRQRRRQGSEAGADEGDLKQRERRPRRALRKGNERKTKEHESESEGTEDAKDGEKVGKTKKVNGPNGDGPKSKVVGAELSAKKLTVAQ